MACIRRPNCKAVVVQPSLVESPSFTSIVDCHAPHTFSRKCPCFTKWNNCRSLEVYLEAEWEMTGECDWNGQLHVLVVIIEVRTGCHINFSALSTPRLWPFAFHHSRVAVKNSYVTFKVWSSRLIRSAVPYWWPLGVWILTKRVFLNRVRRTRTIEWSMFELPMSRQQYITLGDETEYGVNVSM